MKQKHFTFDLDYFPISSSNIFQSIKIQQKNLNKNKNKNGLKRFSIKNELNFQQIPQVMYFQKSIKKNKRLDEKQCMNSMSNKTKKSGDSSDEETIGNFANRSDQNNAQMNFGSNKTIYQATTTEQDHQIDHSKYESLNKISVNSLIQVQKKLKSKHLNFLRQQRKGSQELESLQECESEFDESQGQAKTIPSVQNKKDNNTFQKYQNSDKKINLKKQFDKQTKGSYNQKCSSKKKNKISQVDIKNNPQVGSNKSRKIKQNDTFQKDKQQNSLRNSVLAQQNKKNDKKYISLNKKSYYVIGSKNNKHRSLNKQKKIKNKSQRQDENIFLINGDVQQNLSNPVPSLKNKSLSSSVRSKFKLQSCKSTKQSVGDKKDPLLEGRLSLPSRNQSRTQIKLFQLLRKTQEILNKYKGECSQLKKQKQEYEGKYNQAMKKLNRIKEELECQCLVRLKI